MNVCSRTERMRIETASCSGSEAEEQICGCGMATWGTSPATS